MNFSQPERWVENNTMYSTKLPDIEVKVAASMPYKKGEKTDAIVDSTSGYRHSPSDYVQQAECVKKQEAGWLELNR